MRKVILSQNISVDGYFCGPKGELDWHVVEKEFNEYAAGLLNSVDTIIFGRVTYQMMAGFWTTPEAARLNPEAIVDRMNGLAKVVFSKSLDKVEWNNSRLVRDDPAKEISLMKKLPGKDRVILGSGTIATALAQAGLIDDYRIIVHPIVLGRGKPLLEGLGKRLNLKLMKTRVLGSGVVILYYVPA
jgi:dihydrofolate reductase